MSFDTDIRKYFIRILKTSTLYSRIEGGGTTDFKEYLLYKENHLLGKDVEKVSKDRDSLPLNLSSFDEKRLQASKTLDLGFKLLY